MKLLKIWGSSDDLIEFEGFEDGDEFGHYARDSEYIISGLGEDLCYVKASYGYNGVWRFALGPVEDEGPFPKWPISIRQGSRETGENGYTTVIEIEIPDDVKLSVRDLSEKEVD